VDILAKDQPIPPHIETTNQRSLEPYLECHIEPDGADLQNHRGELVWWLCDSIHAVCLVN
jgi:hypothetical protein